jgi:hypothetical protein
MISPLLVAIAFAFVSRLGLSMEHPFPDFHDETALQRNKPGVQLDAGFVSMTYDLKETPGISRACESGS